MSPMVLKWSCQLYFNSNELLYIKWFAYFLITCIVAFCYVDYKFLIKCTQIKQLPSKQIDITISEVLWFLLKYLHKNRKTNLKQKSNQQANIIEHQFLTLYSKGRNCIFLWLKTDFLITISLILFCFMWVNCIKIVMSVAWSEIFLL